jgi:hypothetical protein
VFTLTIIMLAINLLLFTSYQKPRTKSKEEKTGRNWRKKIPSISQGQMSLGVKIARATINQLVQKLNYKGNAVYLPPKYLKDPETSTRL